MKLFFFWTSKNAATKQASDGGLLVRLEGHGVEPRSIPYSHYIRNGAFVKKNRNMRGHWSLKPSIKRSLIGSTAPNLRSDKSSSCFLVAPVNSIVLR